MLRVAFLNCIAEYHNADSPHAKCRNAEFKLLNLYAGFYNVCLYAEYQ